MQLLFSFFIHHAQNSLRFRLFLFSRINYMIFRLCTESEVFFILIYELPDIYPIQGLFRLTLVQSKVILPQIFCSKFVKFEFYRFSSYNKVTKYQVYFTGEIIVLQVSWNIFVYISYNWQWFNSLSVRSYRFIEYTKKRNKLFKGLIE